MLAVAMVAGATPTKDTNPSLAGTAQVGATLTLTQGTYTASGTDPVVRAESWQRCNNAGGGGCDALSPQPSGLSYQLQGADLGKFIRVTETASDGSGDPVVTDTNSIGPIAAAPQAPAKTTDPVVSAPDLVFDQTPPSVTVQP
ncbi:MAG TPA: hypothetical protein VFR43_05265, partial [Gaiellaceae bacterium]|nr:hypothetical protein [Gaiellaceae bacterium]